MTLITFVIPVRHPENAADWQALKFRLSQTMSSISAQSNSDWRAVIVADHVADLPDLPPRFSVVRVDFPPNPHYDLDSGDRESAYDAVRLDKGRRILAGMLSARDTRFFMIVDDDDLISSNIVEYVSRHPTENGWKIDKGYLWSEGGKLLFQHDNFYNFCGTSLIVRSDLYKLPDSLESAGEDYIRSMLGSHIRISGILEELGAPLARLPFRGAVYRVGHSGAHSKSPTLIRLCLLDRSNLRRPARLLRNLTRFRLLDTALRREFSVPI